MTGSLPTSIAGAGFLTDPALIAVLDAVEATGGSARIVGGAVRNMLMGEAVADLDIATTARPDAVTAAARARGLKVVPTGIDHGTVTVIAEGKPFEVTTLRADVETDGRRAVVAFTDDWRLDAMRRDFTMNAIYADRHGRLFDPVMGVGDALARRVRFIGVADERIREDYLRILRFFRFHARYGSGPPDAAGLAACIRNREGMRLLSRERISAEFRKTLAAPGADAALRLMAEGELLAFVCPGPVDVERFARLRGLAAPAGMEVDYPLALAALADDIGPLAAALRLSNAEQRRLSAIREWSDKLRADGSDAAVKLAVYKAGNAVAAAAVLTAAAFAEGDADRLALARTWTAPAFPLRAADLVAAGWVPGRALGAELRRREAEWIAADFGRLS